MNRPWESEIDVSCALACQLIESQFSELVPVSASEFGAGWDNVVFAVNDVWLFRFPRRSVAVTSLETETRVLPSISDQLPMAVPVPQFIGEPGDVYPWPFFGYRKIPGRAACDMELSRSERVELAPAIGKFLNGLHTIPIDAVKPLHVPDDAWGRFDRSKRIPQVRQYLERCVEHRLIEDSRPFLAIVESLAPLLVPAPARELVHGDFYSKHLLIDDENQPTGIIDWGDVHLGDRAVDLSIGWGFLPSEARNSFRDAYGPIDDATWSRARFRALNHAAITAVYGQETDDDALRRESLISLGHVLEE